MFTIILYMWYLSRYTSIAATNMYFTQIKTEREASCLYTASITPKQAVCG